MAWSLVSPSNRGIGFALARHLLQTTRIPVVATTRRNVEGVRRSILEGLEGVDGKRLTVLELDVTDEATIKKAAHRTSTLFPPSSSHLRLSLIVPGILYPEKSPSQISGPDVVSTFATNTIGPLLLLKHFSPFLPRKNHDLPAQTSDSMGLPPHAVWATMSARVGSIGDNKLGGWYSYRASKAAVNSLTKSFDIWLRRRCEGVAMAVALHPGTVKTGLSKEFWGSVKEDKLFSTEFAAERLVSVLRELEVEKGRGRCWDWEGKEIPP